MQQSHNKPRSYSEESTNSNSQNYNFGGVPIGITLLGAGIVLINLNERRAVKQDQLDALCRAQCKSLSDGQATAFVRDPPADPKVLDGEVLHVCGELKVIPGSEKPHDSSFEVRPDGIVRLRRKTEMFQWHETKHETKDKEGNVVSVTYSHNKQWSTSPLQTHDGRNPSFPRYGTMFEDADAELHVVNTTRGKLLSLVLKFSPNFVQRLTNFESIKVATADDGAAARGLGLSLVDNGRCFYSLERKESEPEIGDVRVSYEAVKEGMYTALGKYTTEKGLVSYTARLKQSLASQGKLVVPKEAHDAVERATMGMENQSFVIPSWVIESVESVMLTVAPIEFAYVHRGEESLSRAFSGIGREHEETTQMLLIVGGILNVAGCLLMASPATAFVGGSAQGAAVVAGMGITAATRKGVKEQLHGATANTPKNADVEL